MDPIIVIPSSVFGEFTITCSNASEFFLQNKFVSKPATESSQTSRYALEVEKDMRGKKIKFIVIDSITDLVDKKRISNKQLKIEQVVAVILGGPLWQLREWPM